MQSLFSEIQWLSAELRRRPLSRPETEPLLVAARGFLETLATQGSQTVPSVARLRNSSRQNAQIMANRLERLGCVEFVPNPNHKKSALLRLTPRGRELVAAANQQEHELLSALSDQMSAAELAVAVDFLRRLRALVSAESSAAGTPAPVLPHGASGVQPLPPAPSHGPPEPPEEEDIFPLNLL